MSPLDVVLFSLEPWDEVWRRNQLLVDQILRLETHARILFVEPPVDVLHATLRRRVPEHLGVREVVSGHVWAFRPVKILPRAVGGQRIDEALGRRSMQAARKLGLHQPVLWVNDISYAALAVSTSLGVVYDVTDDWLEAATTSRDAVRRQLGHAALVGRADEVSVVSDALSRTIGGIRRTTRIPDAVDVDHFRRPQPRPSDVPNGPFVAYIGTLHAERIDVRLAAEVASRIAPVPFLLVGPDALDAASRAVLLSAGCHLVGPRPYAQVPAYYQHAEVIVVPHVVSPFTESLDPIKLYECLAVGRPTVSTPVAGMRDAPPPIESVSPSDFATRVAGLVRVHQPSRPNPVPSWTERAESLLELLHRAGSASRNTGGRVQAGDG